MKAALYHVPVNVGDAANSLPFYRALLGYLEYRPVHDEDGVAGFSDGRTDLHVPARAASTGGSA
ncbi:MAG TPA: hypothetical protein VFT95_08900 [Micromonosporaceae bacterium]|nr:hypothetical protein [Micromonosporaceae bacterium]